MEKVAIDDKNAIPQAWEPIKESNIVYAKSTFHYIGRWSWLYLWMFPTKELVAESPELMTRCTLYVKYGFFGNIYVVGEAWQHYVNDKEIKEYEDKK